VFQVTIRGADQEKRMDTRSDVLDWLRAHPRDIHGDASDIIESCEREVRRHAAADAWLSARDYADSQRDLWEHRFGYPISSSSFVAREMCALYARALRKHKPEVAEGTERHLAGDDVVAAVEPIAWDEMRPWIRALAQREEDVVWKQVIRFTRRCAHTLPEQRAGMESDWDTFDGTYAHAAAVVSAQLMHEYEAMARAAETSSQPSPSKIPAPRP
jgi:hypothetical protein